MATKPPDETSLYEAGLEHLARYPATEVSMARVLARRIDRWARLHAGQEAVAEETNEVARLAKSFIPNVIARLRDAGALSDAGFAASRAKRLRREGKSRRFTMAHLAAKGVGAGTVREVVADDPARELAAACMFLRRRRAGPFGEAAEMKVLAAMGRGGFSQEVARRAMGMDRDEAEALIGRFQD